MLCNQIAFLDPRMSPVSQMKSRAQAPFHARAGDDRCHMKIGTPHIGDPGSRNILGTPGSPFSQDFGDLLMKMDPQCNTLVGMNID